MVFHGVLIHLRIEKNGAVCVDPGHTETVSFHIFQEYVAVLLRTGDRQTQLIFQLLHLHTGEVIIQHTDHNP